MKQILLAEDEEMLGGIIKDTLEIKGYKVRLAKNGKQALEIFMEHQPDLMVLDITMPIVNGYDVAIAIRKINTKMPIIFLSAKNQTTDVLAGFDAGANDYIRKPFSIDELLARIHVLLKQLPDKTASVYNIGNYVFDADGQTLSISNEKIQISYKESQLLNMLCKNMNNVLSKDEVLKQLWGDNNMHNSRNMDVVITKLRTHLSQDTSIKIINLRGIGYKLVTQP